MVALKDKLKIIERFLKGESKSIITRAILLNRDLVRNYISTYQVDKDALNEVDFEALIKSIVINQIKRHLLLVCSNLKSFSTRS